MTAIGRATAGLSVDTVVALDRRRERLGFDKLGELQQNMQVGVSGYAGAKPKWEEIELVFGVQFVTAAEQRYSNLTEPHFTYGVVLNGTPPAGPSAPVIISAAVKEWVEDETGSVVGCKLWISAHSPDATIVYAYAGSLHLTFQGFGAPIDEGMDL